MPCGKERSTDVQVGLNDAYSSTLPTRNVILRNRSILQQRSTGGEFRNIVPADFEIYYSLLA
jgi:hypothetical protein